MYVFISPHFDDAIGSAGGVIKRLVESGEDCCVMTIMAAVPWSRPKSAYYVLHRRRENRRAASILKCNVVNASFYDVIYRKEMKKIIDQSKKNLFTAEITEHDLVEKIREYILINTKPEDVLFAPVGLGEHIDHRIVNLAVQGLDRSVYFYEEFYYDIDNRESPLTVDYTRVYLSQNEITEKLCAMLQYKKTLRKLFCRNWRERTTQYYMEERIHDNKAYERFNNVCFLERNEKSNCIVNVVSAPDANSSSCN